MMLNYCGVASGLTVVLKTVCESTAAARDLHRARLLRPSLALALLLLPLLLHRPLASM